MPVYGHEKLAKFMLTNTEQANFLRRYPIIGLPVLVNVYRMLPQYYTMATMNLQVCRGCWANYRWYTLHLFRSKIQ